MPEHTVIVTCACRSADLDEMFELEEKLESVIEENEVGEYDGNEVAVDGSEAILYMYGPDADRLFSVVKPILEAASFMTGAVARLRYGPPEEGVLEIEVKLAS